MGFAAVWKGTGVRISLKTWQKLKVMVERKGLEGALLAQP